MFCGRGRLNSITLFCIDGYSFATRFVCPCWPNDRMQVFAFKTGKLRPSFYTVYDTTATQKEMLAAEEALFYGLLIFYIYISIK